jgi:hypothetical protein
MYRSGPDREFKQHIRGPIKVIAEISRSGDMTVLRAVLPLALTLVAPGAFHNAQRPPTSTLVYRNDCPHEPPCAESLWVADQRLVTYARLNDRSRRSFTIAKGQRFAFDSGVIVVDRPGRFAITKAEGRYRVGDTVYVLGYEGEGLYRAWHRDTVTTLFNENPAIGKAVSKPRFTWWAQVRDSAGRHAWLALRNVTDDGIFFAEEIDMMPSRNRR